MGLIAPDPNNGSGARRKCRPYPQQYCWLMEELKAEQSKANEAVSGLSVI